MEKYDRVTTQRQHYRQIKFSKNLGLSHHYIFSHSYLQFTTFTHTYNILISNPICIHYYDIKFDSPFSILTNLKN